MATIRPLERDDLPALATLLRDNLGWRRDEDVLARTLLDHPWAPEPVPTLVALGDDGKLIGSLGAQARRVLFDGSPLRGIAVSHLVVDAERRGGAAGALLVRELLAGEQDLTWTDSGTVDVVRIWRTFGAHLDHARSANWMLVLRPVRWLSKLARLAVSPGSERRHSTPVGALPLQLAGRRLIPRAFPEASDGVRGEAAEPQAIADLLPNLDKGFRLRVDYDPAYLSWLHDHVSSLGAPLIYRLVRRGDRAVGWYAYIRQAGGTRLIHLAAPHREVDAVFGEFVAHSRGEGAALLAGRLEPHLDEPVRRRLAAIGLAQRPILHAHDPELRGTLSSSASLLTEMDLIDSEWW
jgi:hypothetical protein